MLKKSFLATCLCTMLMLSLCGCYRMPTDDDFSVVPTVNNPAVTCEKQSFLPNMGTY